MSHPCAVCDTEIPNGKLMCPRHWKLVPQADQAHVMRAWLRFNTSTGGLGSRQRAHRLYLAARDAAIAQALTALEHSTTPETGAL